MKALLTGIDPSFNNMACSTVTDEKKIYLNWCTSSLGTTVDFTKSFQIANKLTNEFTRKLKEKFGKIDYFVTETPPPSSTYSAGLFCLDGLMVYKLSRHVSPKKIYSVSSSYLAHLHNSNKYTKNDSKTLAIHFMNLLTDEHGFEVIIEDRKFNPDMAEAFLFMIKGMCIENILGMRELLESELSSLMGINYKVIHPVESE